LKVSHQFAKRTVGLSFVLCLGSALFFGWKSEVSQGGVRPVVPVSKSTAGPARTLMQMPTLVDIGSALFNDVNLSNPPGQSCASCHGAEAGFKMPLQRVNVQSGIAPGAVKGRFESRIPPTINYAVYLPGGPPHFTSINEAFIGGLFWDGRATGLNDQVHFPLENPNEMNNTTGLTAIVSKVEQGETAWMFRSIYGPHVFDTNNSLGVFNLITQALAAYESSPEISPFSSKYDQFIHGKVKLTNSEWNGLRLVTGSTTGRPGGPPNYKSAHCVDCHGIPIDPANGPDLWTNSCYGNIGVPRNLKNPYYTMTSAAADPKGFNPLGAAFVDLGLGGSFYPFQYNLPPGNMGAGSNGQGDFLLINGDFKAPTLRNVDKRPNPGFVKRYTHNGYFTDLKTIVHFYNTRNLTTYPGEVIDFTAAQPYANLKGTPLWPPPEYPNPITLQNPTGAPNSQSAQVGNLGLTNAEENDIVAFLKTLTDGYGPGYPVALPAPAAPQTQTATADQLKQAAMRSHHTHR
jgi:cytochrome c peroxidase